ARRGRARGGDGAGARGAAPEQHAVARAHRHRPHRLQGHAEADAVRPGRRLAAGRGGAMRVDYSEWEGARPRDAEFLKQLMEIYRNLLLQTGGDVDEALRWMEHFGREYGFFDENFTVEDFKKLLEETGEARRTARGFEMTPRGERRIRQDSLNE